MTLRSLVTRSLTHSLFTTLLVAGAPLSVFAASDKGVAVWLTTDKASLLAEHPQRPSFGRASVGAETILVDDHTKSQTTDLNGVNSCFVRAYYC
jgi:hypothetical protein